MADPVLKHDGVLTYDDYAKLPTDGNRIEFLEGELVMTPAPSTRHQRVSRNLEFILHGYVQKNGFGEIFDAPFDVILDERTILQPDLAYFSAECKTLITERGGEGPPDCIVEILSPATSRLDRIRKFRLYARFGVRWYWIVDPDGRTVEEYERADDSYIRRGECEGDETFAPHLFPGFEIRLTEIWA